MSMYVYIKKAIIRGPGGIGRALDSQTAPKSVSGNWPLWPSVASRGLSWPPVLSRGLPWPAAAPLPFRGLS